MADHSSSFSFFSKRTKAEQEIPASAEEESVPQDTPLPPSSSFPISPYFQPPFVSNSFPLPPNNSPSPQESVLDQEKPTNHTNNPTPMITIDDDHTYQDSPFLTLDPLEQVFRPGVLDTFPFFHPSASNVPLPAAPLVRESVPSIDGEADSSSGVSFRGLSIQELPSGLLRSPFRNPNVWVNRPPPSVYKLNVAVTLCDDEGIRYLGLGGVIRDHDGFVHQAITTTWEDYESPNPDLAEEYIYRFGISLSLARGYRRLIAETERDWLVADYQDSFRPDLFDYFEASCVSVNDNRLAHEFARMAILNENLGWTPEQIVEVFGSLTLPY